MKQVLKKIKWCDVLAGDVFTYTYEDHSRYVATCLSTDGETLMVSDMLLLSGKDSFDVDFSIQVDDSSQYILDEILFHHVSIMEELEDRFPEMLL